MDAQGNPRMVDVGDKDVTRREAVAEGWISMSADAFSQILSRSARKGDVLQIAQLAGITGAKHTSSIVPLCHPIPIDGVEIELDAIPSTHRVTCKATVRTSWRTGVEMEALSAVNAALLTVYDMLKAVDRGMEIGGVRLVSKSGGRSGDWTREAGEEPG